MSACTFKRKEIKDIMSDERRSALEESISKHIEADVFGQYTICNVYMDTPDHRLIRRSIEKPVYKEKMRIRSYGIAENNSKVFVELKKKYQGIVYKRRVSMPLGESSAYIHGEAARNGQIESEIDYFIDMYTCIAPAMFIAYDRTAFSAKEDSKLRITFDKNILWRDQDVSLTSGVYGQKIIEENQCLMEIKCANAIPL